MALICAVLLTAAIYFTGLCLLPQELAKKGWTLPAEQGRRPAAGILLPLAVTGAFYLALLTATLSDARTGGASAASAGVMLAWGLYAATLREDAMQFLRRTEEPIPALQRLLPKALLLTAYLLIVNWSGQLSTLTDLPFGGLVQLSYGYLPLMLLLLVLFAAGQAKVPASSMTCTVIPMAEALGFLGAAWALGNTAVMLLNLSAAVGCVFSLIARQKGFVAPGRAEHAFLTGVLIASALELDYPLLLLWAALPYGVWYARRLIRNETSDTQTPQSEWMIWGALAVGCAFLIALCGSIAAR